jgi:histidinol-phosphate aminotransferase
MNKYFLDHLTPFSPYVSQHDEADFGKIRLNQNEGLLNFPKEILDNAINRIAQRVNYYPDPNSIEVVSLYAKKIKLNPEEILITNGSNHALEVVGRALLDHTREIVIDSPTYEVMKMQAGIQNATIVPAISDRPFVDSIDHLINAITEKTSVVYLANPANPIGKLYSQVNIEKILGTGKMVVLDEAYIDYAPVSSVGLLNRYDNLIIVRTLSKAYLAAGLRIGFILSNRENISLLRKVIPPWSLNHISQALAYELLSNEALFLNYVNTVKVSKTFLYSELDKMSIKYHPSETNFLLVEFEDPSFVVKELYKYNILVSNKSGLPGLKGYIRVSIGPLELMKIFVTTLKEILKK